MYKFAQLDGRAILEPSPNQAMIDVMKQILDINQKIAEALCVPALLMRHPESHGESILHSAHDDPPGSVNMPSLAYESTTVLVTTKRGHRMWGKKFRKTPGKHADQWCDLNGFLIDDVIGWEDVAP